MLPGPQITGLLVGGASDRFRLGVYKLNFCTTAIMRRALGSLYRYRSMAYFGGLVATPLLCGPDAVATESAQDAAANGLAVDVDRKLSIPIERRCDMKKVEKVLLRWYSCQHQNKEGDSMLAAAVTFEDPVWRLNGPDEFKKGMQVLAMVLPYAEIDDYKWWSGRESSGQPDLAVGPGSDSSGNDAEGEEATEIRPDEATLWLRARYGFSSNGSGIQFPLQTGIRVRLDEQCQLCRVEDCWNGVALPSRHSAGIFGLLVENFRSFNGSLACSLASAKSTMDGMRGEPPERIVRERSRLRQEAEERLASSMRRVQERQQREKEMDALAAAVTSEDTDVQEGRDGPMSQR